MKFHSSLKTKCYLIMAPLVGMFLLLTFAMVHATWQLRRGVAQVENEASDALWSGRLARASNQLQTDYWELLETGRASEADQMSQDAAEVERVLDHFRQENEAVFDQADVALPQSVGKGFELAMQKAEQAARKLIERKAAAEGNDEAREAGLFLAEALAPTRIFAQSSERGVERATADLVATSRTTFGRNSAIYRVSAEVSPAAHEIAQLQRVILALGAEVSALGCYEALRDGSRSSAERLDELKYRHVETTMALDDLAKHSASDDPANPIDTIRRRYEAFTLLSSRLTSLPRNSGVQSREEEEEEIEEEIESQVNGLHSSLDQFAALRAGKLRSVTDRLRGTLRRTELLLASLLGFFLIIAAGVPYMLVKKITVPIARLTAAVCRFENGDLHAKVPATSTDEIGELASGFNSMTQALAENVEELRRAQDLARASENQLKLILESAGEAIYGIDLQGHCTFCNPTCVRLLGYQQADELLGKNMHDLIHHSHADGKSMPVEECRIFRAFKVGMGSHVDSEVLWKADGTSFPAEYRSFPQLQDGRAVGAVVTFTDITERKQAETKIESLAYFDALTGLPNRLLLQDRLSKALARARRYHEKLAVLFLDLDGFKVINDSLGHSVGDLLLKQVAERLQSCAREQDTVARLGGDEFVVLLTSVDKVADVGVAAERIRKALTTEFVVLEQALQVSCSLGVSLFPDHTTDGETLVKYADAAMYRAKDGGRNNVQFFTEEMNAEVMERLALENSLRRAQERNELYLMYQPQVDILTGEIVGTEALIRWQHPELGLLSPDKFIPIAENSGLIIPIGEWVLRTACAQVKQWQQDGLPAIPVSVNVSAVQFRQAGFVELVGTVLQETGLAPQYLELEITESLLLSNRDVLAVFRKLNEMGVKLSIDDFGTGYSSLGYLRHFPIYKLKIDRSFVRDLTVDSDDAAITGTIISMARNLGIRVIAEGVEQQEQLAFLQSHDCDEAQGFFFSRPVMADAIAELRTKFVANKAIPALVGN